MQCGHDNTLVVDLADRSRHSNKALHGLMSVLSLRAGRDFGETRVLDEVRGAAQVAFVRTGRMGASDSGANILVSDKIACRSGDSIGGPRSMLRKSYWSMTWQEVACDGGMSDYVAVA